MSHAKSSLKEQQMELCVEGTFFFSLLFAFFPEGYVRPKYLKANTKKRDKIEAYRFGEWQEILDHSNFYYFFYLVSFKMTSLQI